METSVFAYSAATRVLRGKTKHTQNKKHRVNRKRRVVRLTNSERLLKGCLLPHLYDSLRADNVRFFLNLFSHVTKHELLGQNKIIFKRNSRRFPYFRLCAIRRLNPEKLDVLLFPQLKVLRAFKIYIFDVN